MRRSPRDPEAAGNGCRTGIVTCLAAAESASETGTVLMPVCSYLAEFANRNRTKPPMYLRRKGLDDAGVVD
ncbi:MAG: hypothetical protein M3509_00760, partial [Chloroflexota bacterium]|nr:hypothetical protein [Chloroflexota bacterium]